MKIDKMIKDISNVIWIILMLVCLFLAGKEIFNPNTYTIYITTCGENQNDKELKE